MLGGLSYLGFNLIYIPLLVFGIIFIIKHQGKLKPWQENLILAFIAVGYWANFFEKLGNGNPPGGHFNKIHPLANLSPTLFAIVTLMIFIPRKYRTYLYALIGIMSPAMLLASLYNGIGYIFTQGQYLYTCLIFDIVIHGLFALFGLYIIRNKIIEFNRKQIIVAISIVAFFVILVIVLNLIFDTSFYGLNFNGKHNIYTIVFTDNSFLSNTVYLIGLTVLLALGVFLRKLISTYIDKRDQKV